MADSQIDLGNVGLMAKGDYSAAVQYHKSEFVIYEGSSYVCVEDSIGEDPSDSAKWKLLARKGDDGPVGPAGPEGPQGEHGDGDVSSVCGIRPDDSGNVELTFPVTSVNGSTGAVTLAAADVGAVPTTRTVNTKALSSNISLTAADVGAVPTSRKVNGKALTSDITLSAGDVSARANTWMPTAAQVGALPSTTKVATFSLQGTTLYITY